jgi:hypothetical protein
MNLFYMLSNIYIYIYIKARGQRPRVPTSCYYYEISQDEGPKAPSIKSYITNHQGGGSASCYEIKICYQFHNARGRRPRVSNHILPTTGGGEAPPPVRSTGKRKLVCTKVADTRNQHPYVSYYVSAKSGKILGLGEIFLLKPRISPKNHIKNKK